MHRPRFPVVPTSWFAFVLASYFITPLSVPTPSFPSLHEDTIRNACVCCLSDGGFGVRTAYWLGLYFGSFLLALECLAGRQSQR